VIDYKHQKQKGYIMAEQIRRIETKLQTLETGLDNGLITKREFNELSSTVIFELKALVNNI
jgi:hypothetical protein